MIDLTNWKLTLPVDADYFTGSGDYKDGKAYEVLDLEGFEAPPFFYYDGNALIFRADVDGAKTSSSTNYTRTELREMNGTALAAWTLAEGGTLSATLKVMELATEFDGSPARIVIGQIHGQNDELTRLYYDAEGQLYYANEKTGADLKERLFYFANEAGERPNVALGETFSYIIEVVGGRLIVQVFADGRVYSATPTNGLDPTEIVSDWSGDRFYFKAGVYQGVTTVSGHSRQGTGSAAAAFYGIDLGRGAWLGDVQEPPAEPEEPVLMPYRDMVAIEAMVALLRRNPCATDWPSVAASSYEIADAMVAARG